MKSKVIFGKWEGITVLLNLLGVQVFLNFPRSMAEAAGTAGWILALYVSLLALLLFAWITKLYSKFEGMDILDVSEKAAGRIGKIIFGLIIIAHITLALSSILREFGEDMKVIAFNVSPISYVMLFFLVGMILGAYAGLEAIVRFHAIVVPIILVFYIIALIAVSPYYHFSNLLPIMGNGANTIFISGLSKISIFAPLIIYLLIVPFIRTHGNFKTVGYVSIGISSFIFVSSALFYVAAMSYPTCLENFLPVYELSRLIYLGRFFQRVESLFVLSWAASALLYLSMGFFALVYVFKKIFNLEYYKPLIIPLSILIFVVSLLPKNLMEAITLETSYFRSWTWIDAFALTIIILLLAGARKRSNKKEEDKIV